MNRPGPAPERGGTPDALDAVRKRGGLTKARNTSVIADMTRAEDAPTADPPLPALHAVPTAAAEPALTPAETVPVQQPQPAAYVQSVQQIPQQTQALLQQPVPVSPEPEKKEYRKTSFFQTKESGSRMRSAYMATRHLTQYRTLSDFILAAVEREVEALERQYNEGNLFTADPGSVPRGRPLEI